MPSALGSSVMIGATVLVCRLTRVRKGARLAENTHSGCAATNYDAVVPDHAWSMSIPWDDTNLPDVDFGLNAGDKVTLKFLEGSTGKFEVLSGTTVESVENIRDNSGDIIRTEASGKGGVLTPAVT